MQNPGRPGMTEQMTEQTALGAEIEKHWREHRPQMVRDLEKSGQLEKTVLEAQELTGDLLYELVSVKKMDYQAAWELASREWAFLPEETGNQGSGTRSRKGKRSPPRKAKAPPVRSRGQASGKSEKSSQNRSRKRRRKTSG